MKRFFPMSVALAASLTLTACVPNEMSVQLVHATVPDVDGDTGSCLADPSGTPVAAGFFDVGATNAFLWQSFTAKNNMEVNTDEGSERLNSRDFIIERAVVSYGAVEQDLQGLMESLGERETPMSGTIEAGGDAGIWVNIVPRDVSAVLASEGSLSDPSARATIIVNTQIEGHMQNGQGLFSSTVSFPVEICNRCMFCAGGVEPAAWSCGSPGRYPGLCL
ncbi:MAG: hypothetical protein P1V51_17830 [Deltaproteobacteria bacterium]|nr:hypothetical protein [Deltaproteobacteria bacterium]